LEAYRKIKNQKAKGKRQKAKIGSYVTFSLLTSYFCLLPFAFCLLPFDF
jgi:hypothetical protein